MMPLKSTRFQISFRHIDWKDQQNQRVFSIFKKLTSDNVMMLLDFCQKINLVLNWFFNLRYIAIILLSKNKIPQRYRLDCSNSTEETQEHESLFMLSKFSMKI